MCQHLLHFIFIEEFAVAEISEHSLLNSFLRVSDVILRKHCFVKLQAIFRTENTVGNDEVEMWMIVQGVAEVLDEAYSADLRVFSGRTASNKPFANLVHNYF